MFFLRNVYIFLLRFMENRQLIRRIYLPEIPGLSKLRAVELRVDHEEIGAGSIEAFFRFGRAGEGDHLEGALFTHLDRVLMKNPLEKG